METGHLPFDRFVRLENGSFGRHRDKFSLAFSLCRRPHKRRVQTPAQRSEPRHGEPEQCDYLKSKYEQARTVADIQANPKVALGFTGEGGIFSDAIYVAIEGSAELIRDKAAFKAHWTSDLDRWFDKGVDTPNIVLIKVKANRITYWDGEEEGEVQV